MSEANDLLDIGEAARFLSGSEPSLRRWTSSGAPPCLRLGHRRERLSGFYASDLGLITLSVRFIVG